MSNNTLTRQIETNGGGLDDEKYRSQFGTSVEFNHGGLPQFGALTTQDKEMTVGSSNLTTGRTDLDQFNLPSSHQLSARGNALMSIPVPITKVQVSTNSLANNGSKSKFGGIPKQNGNDSRNMGKNSVGSKKQNRNATKIQNNSSCSNVHNLGKANHVT